MVAIVLNVLILAVCVVVLVRSPNRPWAYWGTLAVFVALTLVLSGLAGHQFGSAIGIAVLVVIALFGRVFVRPHLIHLRQR